MRFMAPRGVVRRSWRALVLALAPRFAAIRRRVNSGSLAEPARYPATGPDGAGLPRHGSVAPDLLLAGGTRLREGLGSGFVVLAPRSIDLPQPVIDIGRATAYGDDRAWLVRPDGYLADSRPLDDAGELGSALSELAGAATRPR